MCSESKNNPSKPDHKRMNFTFVVVLVSIFVLAVGMQDSEAQGQLPWVNVGRRSKKVKSASFKKVTTQC